MNYLKKDLIMVIVLASLVVISMAVLSVLNGKYDILGKIAAKLF